MKFTRKGFFKSIFGGFVAAAATPSLIKAEEKPQTKVESYPLTLDTNAYLGLGTSHQNIPLVVSSLVFQVGERQLLMSGNEKGDFEIKWLDVKEDENAATLSFRKPEKDRFPILYK
jgi:hypothetical protein